MAPKRTPKHKPQVAKPSLTFGNPRLRALIPIIAILIIGAAVLVFHLLRSNSNNDPVATADSFLMAYAGCDATTAQKYYLVFQTNPDAVTKYKKSCVRGTLHFKFNRVLNPPAATDKSKHNANLLYDYTDSSGRVCQVMVTLVRSGDNKPWVVFGATLTSYTQACLQLP